MAYVPRMLDEYDAVWMYRVACLHASDVLPTEVCDHVNSTWLIIANASEYFGPHILSSNPPKSPFSRVLWAVPHWWLWHWVAHI